MWYNSVSCNRTYFKVSVIRFSNIFTSVIILESNNVKVDIRNTDLDRKMG